MSPRPPVARCPDHDVELNAIGVCRSCRAEQIADDNPRQLPAPAPDTASVYTIGAALVRTKLREAGIDPTHESPTR